jgi:hypothetical protein
MNRTTHLPHSEALTSTDNAAPTSNFQTTVDQTSHLRERLRALRFSSEGPPQPTEGRFFINQQPVCTPGNISTLISQTKVGKSSFLGGLIAANLVAETGTPGVDTLGWTSIPPEGKVLIHIDTEQSPSDHDRSLRRELKRVGVPRSPDWLHSYSLATFAPNEILEAIALLAKDAEGQGIQAILIDGVSDLISEGVNDLEASVTLVRRLQQLALRHNTVLLCVIHENEGRIRMGEARGHLGKELMRKAESNLRLEKSGESAVIFAEKTRGAPIPRKHGHKMQWDDSSQMHRSVEASDGNDTQRRNEVRRTEAAKVFANLGSEWANYTRLLEEAARIRNIELKSAEAHLKRWASEGIMEKGPEGLWRLTPNPADTPKSTLPGGNGH